MTVAYELLKHHFEVVILEASSRLGGKAGADLIGGNYEEHGNHFFPAWYLNTRHLLGELGIADHLVDMKRLHQLRKGRFPHFETLDIPTRLWNLPWNIFHAGVLPWSDAALLVYSFLELACQSNSNQAWLDRMSLNEFIRSRPYGLDAVAEGAQALVLKSIATSTSHLSALTKHTVDQCWLRYRVPMYSILNGNLQERFIEPYARSLIDLGCQIRLGRQIHELVFTGTRISEARFKAGSTEGIMEGDIFVVTTPPEVTAKIVNGHLLQATPELANLAKLQSVPMASMSLYLKRPIPNLPKEHVMLADSKYALSFIDVSQTWSNSDGAVLTFNIGDLEPICSLSSDKMAECIIEELRSFIPEIYPEDIDHYHMRPNLDMPLLVNSKGSWHHRPAAGRTSIDNLYLAGDYCRSAVNITSMEGAITSGLLAAAAILESNGLSSFARILEPKKPPRLVLVALRNLLYPMMLLIAYWSRARKPT
jgi:uncharacterized protein with NAD-binding domain and iron-sulfur cluster